MTFNQLKKAIENNTYVLLRTYSGILVGVNCKALKMMLTRHEYEPRKKSIYESYQPCSFSEYISHKTAFI